MARFQFRLNPELLKYVEKRAEASKITPSEYLRLLIVNDMDSKDIQKNIALDEVNKQLVEMKKSIAELEMVRDQLSV